MLWTRRLKRAQTRHKRFSRDWRSLRRLYVDTGEQRRKWGVDVQLARTLVDGIVADSYIQNPDQYVESQNGFLDGDMEMRLRNLFRTLHEDTDTKTILQRGRVYGATCGFAVHWADHEAEWHTEDVAIEDESGGVYEETLDEKPVVERDGNGKARTRKIVDVLRIKGELVSPHDMLFDPDGRSWDLTDHKWIARLYEISVQDVLDDESGAYSPEGKRWLLSWSRSQTSRRATVDGSANMEETDPAHRMVQIWEVWSRANGWMVYHIPYGAERCIGKYQACECWRLGDTYPATMIAVPTGWNPADEDGDGDFYPAPDLRRVRSQLENLPRLEAAFLDSCTNSARKWFGPSGLFDPKELDRLQTDENRVYIPVTLKAFLKEMLGGEAISAEALMNFDLKKFVSAWPNPDTSEIAKHLEAIQHQLELCFMLMARGPGERGGIPKTESATSSMGIQERLAAFRDMMVEAMAAIADKISAKYFLMLKAHGTVPMRYRIVADNVTTFDVFDTSELADMDLVFRHHVGSSRPPSREARQAERERIFTASAPVLQSMGDTAAVRELLAWVVELSDSKKASRIIDPRLQDMATELLVMLDQFRHGQVALTPENSNALLEMLSTFLAQYLPPSRVQQAAQQTVAATGSEASAPAPAGVGTPAKAPTAGGDAMRRGLAGAGAVGGMNKGAAAA